ncbi:transposase [Capillimicrobium parvum]|uniref:transposase n=1 Tax=Capillimicrobium parvum TaxID=2884022 RepID=UPI0038996712
MAARLRARRAPRMSRSQRHRHRRSGTRCDLVVTQRMRDRAPRRRRRQAPDGPHRQRRHPGPRPARRRPAQRHPAGPGWRPLRVHAPRPGHAPHGREFYRQRQITVEPVFAQIKFNRAIRRFQRRGRAACRSEWRLIAATDDLLKLHSHRPAAATPLWRQGRLPPPRSSLALDNSHSAASDSVTELPDSLRPQR